MSGYIGTQPVPQATQTRDSFTCTAGQTSFATSGYTPNFLDVYLNGVKLTATDYTASNGSDVVLASGAATGDVLEVVAFTPFEAANVTGATDFTVTGNLSVDGGTIKLDGNYPVGTGNVALGNAAGDAMSTGGNNVSVGSSALTTNTSGGDNVAVGSASMANNSSGGYNTSVGRQALASNTTASWNTAVGYQAGNANTTGLITAVGSQALLSNTTGQNNVAVGGYTSGTNYAALTFNTTGSNNTALGNGALQNNTTASNNTAVGYQTAYNNTGGAITAIGQQALYSNTGSSNVAVGYQAAYNNTTGQDNVALGRNALRSNTTASNNTAVGYQTAYSNTTGVENVAMGNQALYSNTTGYENVAIGRSAGYENTTGFRNTYIGDDANQLATTGSNNTVIGRFNGNQGGLDIRTSSNNIVLSDGDGNVRAHCDSSGTWTGVGASTTFGAVGTYIWGRPANLTDYAAGATASGLYATSNKHPDSPPYYTSYASGGWDSAITVATSVSGTWRCMAGTGKYNSNYAPSSLWVRIS